jgi:hypothetical protein
MPPVRSRRITRRMERKICGSSPGRFSERGSQKRAATGEWMVQRVEPRSRRCHSSGAAGSRGGHALQNCEHRRSSSSLIDARAFPSRCRRRGRGACTPGAPVLRCAKSFSCGRLSSFIEPNARPSRLTLRCASGAHSVASLVVSRMRHLSAQRSFSGKGMLPAPTQRGVRSIVKEAAPHPNHRESVDDCTPYPIQSCDARVLHGRCSGTRSNHPGGWLAAIPTASVGDASVCAPSGMEPTRQLHRVSGHRA